MGTVRKTLLFFFILFQSVYIFGQGTEHSGGQITGRITDSASKAPLEYATITLTKVGESKPLNGTTTDPAGHFTIKDVQPGSYSILVEFIGYHSRTLNHISITRKNEQLDLKTIILGKTAEAMQTVVVTARAKLVENKIDKMIFNAERDITSQTGVASDVLKKVPQVSVDVDGNVQLAGSSSIRFLINGKPSSAFGSNVTDVLQAIPASQIKSIEVITNPGAKYDAQGLGGIINIILKNNTAKGINGNLSLTGGTRMDNGSFNFNARKGKLGVNAFISGNLRPYTTTITNYNRLTTDTANKTLVQLQQNASARYNRHGLQTGVGFDLAMSNKDNLSGAASYNIFEYAGNGFNFQNQTTSEEEYLPVVNSTILSNNYSSNQFRFQNTDASLNYKKTFSKEDQELTVGLNTSIANIINHSNNDQYLLPQDSLYYGTRNTNPGKEYETELQIDYTQPLKKDVILGFGGKTVFYDINSTSNVLNYETGSKTFITNNYLSNHLDYRQKVYAFYSELTLPVGKLFDAKIGGRYERTQINAYYSNAQHQVPAHGYNTFVPSVFLSKKLGENGDQTIRLNYSKRIERPDYNDLNPFINTSDPKNFTSGNPYLLPETGNRFELGYNKEYSGKGSLMVTLFYRINNQDIQPYVTYYPSLMVGDTTYTHVSLTTRQNIGQEKNTGVSLFGDLRFNDKLSVRSNVFLFYRHTINTVDPGYNSNSFNYRFNLNASYQFAPTLASEFFGSFNSPRNEVQGRYPSFTTYSLAIRKQFWNKKGSLALTANNFFSEYLDQLTSVKGPNFTSSSLRKIPFRSFGLNFTWKFGKLEFKKEKEKENDDQGVRGIEG